MARQTYIVTKAMTNLENSLLLDSLGISSYKGLEDNRNFFNKIEDGSYRHVITHPKLLNEGYVHCVDVLVAEEFIYTLDFLPIELKEGYVHYFVKNHQKDNETLEIWLNKILNYVE
jgi:hypothetical protein